MSALKAKWVEWSGKFAALARRERIMVAAATVFGGGLLIFNFWVDPFLQKARSAAKIEQDVRTELVQQNAIAEMLKAQKIDPDAANRQRLAQARLELKKVSDRLAQFEAGMVPPARMQAFLEGLLGKHRAIELVGLKTLPVTQVGASMAAEKLVAAAGSAVAKDPASAGTENAVGDGIYQHGIEIRLAGTYNELLNYLTELERMPQRVMWYRIEVKVEPKYPRNVMVLQVFTLSLDRNWLVV